MGSTSRSSSPHVFACIALLLLVALSGLTILVRWQPAGTTPTLAHNNNNNNNQRRTLELVWRDVHENNNNNSTSVQLEPRYFDLETTDTITLRWWTSSDTNTKQEEEEHVVVFQRTAASARIVGHRRMVTWEGARRKDKDKNNESYYYYDATQMATLLHDATPDDAVRGTAMQALTGSFVTQEASFTLTTVSTGDMQIERKPWNMFPLSSSSSSSSDAEEDDLVSLLMEHDNNSNGTSSSSSTTTDTMLFTNWTAGIIHRGGPMYAPLPVRRRRRRRLDEDDDEDVHTVDLLVIVTRRAACEFNREEEEDCELVEETTEPMDRRLALSVSQTNTAFEYGDVNARLRLVETVYLASDFDGRAGIDTLRTMSRSRDVEGYRDDAGADLVMMVTGRHPDNCGIALLNTPLSAIGYDCFGAYTFSHEIGMCDCCCYCVLFCALAVLILLSTYTIAPAL